MRCSFTQSLLVLLLVSSLAQARRRESKSEVANDPMFAQGQIRDAHPARTPMLATGGVMAGVGAISVAAAGISWLTAWGHSRDLDDECYDSNGNRGGRYCIMGTPGGDAYESARDLSDASGVLIAVGIPLLTAGVAITIIGASLPAAPKMTANVGPTGGSMEFTF